MISSATIILSYFSLILTNGEKSVGQTVISGGQRLDLRDGTKATRCKSFMFFFIHFTFWAFYRTDL